MFLNIISKLKIFLWSRFILIITDLVSYCTVFLIGIWLFYNYFDKTYQFPLKLNIFIPKIFEEYNEKNFQNNWILIILIILNAFIIFGSIFYFFNAYGDEQYYKNNKWFYLNSLQMEYQLNFEGNYLLKEIKIFYSLFKIQIEFNQKKLKRFLVYKFNVEKLDEYAYLPWEVLNSGENNKEEQEL